MGIRWEEYERIMLDEFNMHMNRNIMRLGYFSAWGIIVLTILLIAGLLLQLVIESYHWHEWRPAITSYCTVDSSGSFLSYFCGFVVFLQTPLILVLFACFHNYAKRSVIIFSRISLSLVTSFTTLRTLSYILHFNIRSFDMQTSIDGFPLFLHHNSNSIPSVDDMAFTVFMGLAELLIVPVFSKTTLIEKKIGYTLFITGIINLTGALMFILDKSEIFEFCVILSQVFFLIVVILLIKFFGQFKTRV